MRTGDCGVPISDFLGNLQIYRKPCFFPMKYGGIPWKFPVNQSNDSIDTYGRDLQWIASWNGSHIFTYWTFWGFITLKNVRAAFAQKQHLQTVPWNAHVAPCFFFEKGLVVLHGSFHAVLLDVFEDARLFKMTILDAPQNGCSVDLK